MVATLVIIVDCVGSQPALGAGLTAAPGFVKPLNSLRVSMKYILNDVALGTIEVTTEGRSSEGGQISHTIDEKLRVRDVVFPFQFV